MAVLITVENQGQTQPGYDGMLGVLADIVRKAPGFVLHTTHPVEDGWRVIEVWQSIEHAKSVAPRGLSQYTRHHAMKRTINSLAMRAALKKDITMHGHRDDSSRERLQRWALYLALLIMPGGFLIVPAVLWRMGQRKPASSAS